MPNLKIKIFSVFLTIIVFFSTSAFSALAALQPMSAASAPSNLRDRYATDLFTGSATYSYPIKVPKGTNDLTPDVSLGYSSSGVRDVSQSVGAGWQLNQDYVQRDASFTPGDTSDDKYKLHFKGGAYDLVYNPTDSLFHTKIESHLKIQQFLTGGANTTGMYWQVTTPDGTLYRFGYASNSELMCNGRSYDYTWNLDQVQDTHNNHIYYTYSQSGGTSYLSQIRYNNDQTRIIDFTYAANPYQKPVYIQGCSITEVSRLSSIQTKIGTSLVNQYDLSYATAANGQSLLQSITEKGSDGSALPPTTFDYKPTVKNWPLNPEYWIYNADIDVHLEKTDVVQADVTGDGLLDIVKSEGTSSNTWKVWRNTGNGWNTTAEIWENNAPMAAMLTNPDTRLVDVTGDNLPDIVKSEAGGSAGLSYWYVWRNTGSSWSPTPEVWVNNGNIDAYFAQGTVALVDVNGDGLADIIRTWWNGQQEWKVYKNLGNTWSTSPEVWAYGVISQGLDDQTIRLMDVNGDGLVDVVKATANGANDTWQVWKNTGSGWSAAQTWINNAPVDANFGMTNVTVQDVNGDGLPDIVKTLVDPNRWMVLLNLGNSWATTWEEWANPSGAIPASLGLNTQMADVSGDGLADIIRTVATGSVVTWQVWKNNGISPDLLAAIHTPQGGTIGFDYAQSTQYPNTGTDNLSDLPFNTWVVTKMTKNNGLSNSQGTNDITTYSYKNGLYDWQDREFRGFGEVDTVEANGAKKQYIFNQDDAAKGTLASVLITNGAGNPYAKTVNTWSNTLTNNIYTVNLTKEEQYIYDGVLANPKIEETDYQYDSYGNLTKKSELGDASATGDERFMYNEYSVNSTSWITNALKHTYVNGSDDTTKISENWLYYDGNPSYNDAPSKGDLTKKVDWLNGGTNTVTTYGYDSFGNQTSVTDANGHTTTAVYDTVASAPPPTVISRTNSIAVTPNATWQTFDGMSVTDNFTSSTVHISFSVDVVNNTPNSTTYMRSMIDGVQKDFAQFVTGATGASTTMSFVSDQSITPGQHTIYIEYWTNSSTLTAVNRTFSVSQPQPVSPATYPISTTNAKNQTTLMNYDLGTGNLLSKTDPNGNTTSYAYDPFGRILKEIKPNDSANFPTTSYQYFDNITAPQGIMISKREVSGQAGTLDISTFVDGLGRTVQSRADAEDTTKQIVTDSFYDSTGKLSKQTVPYIASSSASTFVPPVSTAFGDGSAGDLVVSVNTAESPVDSSVNASSGTLSAAVGSGLSFAPNQIVLLHQTQGTNAGAWEFKRVQSYSGTTLNLTTALANSYSSTGSNHAQIRVVPQYHNVTVNTGATWTPKAWDGTTGGILAFLANGTVTINGTIRTGYDGSNPGSGFGFRNATVAGGQGEGTTGDRNTVSGAANGNGGGGASGGTDGNRSGGGGGGNGTTGSTGTGSGGTGGSGAAAAGTADLTSMVFGGGGGASTGNVNASGGIGATGAGIVFITGATVNVTGAINSNGGNGQVGGTYVGPGGGSAGGSVLIKTQNATFGTNLVTATGGAGGGGGGGNGGNGGDGRIRVEYETSLIGTTNPTVSSLQATIPVLPGAIASSSSPYVNPDPTAKYTAFTYDTLGRASIITNPKGLSKTIAYDHWKQTTIDENGHIKREFRNAFDKINKVEEVNNINSYTTTYEYDARDLLTKITDDAGNISTFVYDSLGRKTSQVDPDMGTWQYTYDGVGNLLTQKDNRNITTTKTYDELNRVTRVDYPTDTDNTFAYDLGKIGTLSIATDSAGTVNYTYDNRLRKTAEQRTINGTTKTTQFAYDTMDRLTSQTYPDGEVVNFAFNPQGEINSASGSAALLTNLDYNALGKITRKDFGNGITTNYTYNTDDFRLSRIQTGTLFDKNYTYDNVGNIASITDNLTSKTQQFSYDDLDRLLTASESGSFDYAYQYNSIGNLTKFTNSGIATDYTYGTSSAKPHALTASTGSAPAPSPTPTPATPSDAVLLKQIAASSDDAEENAAGTVNLTSTDLELTCDTATNPCPSNDPMKQTIGMRFSSITIPQGATITSAYIEFTGDEVQSEATNVTFYGQAADNAATFTTTASSISSRAKTTASVNWSNLPTWAIGTKYQSPDLSSILQEIINRPAWVSGNAAGIIVTGLGHRTATSYDGGSSKSPKLIVKYRMPTPWTTGPVVKATSVGTVASGGLTLDKPAGTVDGDLLIMTASADLAAGGNVTYATPSGWTNLLPLTRSDAASAGVNLQAWYKIASNEPANYTITPSQSNLIGGTIIRINGHNSASPIDVQAVTASLTGEASAPSVTTTSANELVLRLATWDQSKTIVSTPPGVIQNSHVDVSGHDNWSGYQEQATASSSGVAQFDLSAAAPYVGLTVAIKPAPAGQGGGGGGTSGTTYVYDANGNMTSDGTKCYHYNEANQLDKVTNCASGQTVAEYVYDYNGNRMVKRNFVSGTLDNTVTSWSDSFETKVASGGATTNTSYYFVNNELVAKKDNSGAVTYVHNDHLGSSSVVTNSTGALVESTSYDPWGKVLVGGVQNKFQYTGQEKDSETGLNYYNARYYSSDIRHFTQPDTLISNIYNPQDLNRYSYVNNNPLRYTDPSGHGIVSTFLGWFGFGNKKEQKKEEYLSSEQIKKSLGSSSGNTSGLIGNTAMPNNSGGGAGYSISGVSSQGLGSVATTSVPPAPPGANINVNIGLGLAMRRLPEPIKGITFGLLVMPGGLMDYKQQGKKFEDFGNYSYGAMGTAMGYPPIILGGMAGLVQQITNWNARREGKREVHVEGTPFLGYPNGDSYENGHSQDQDMIINGIQHYNSYSWLVNQ